MYTDVFEFPPWESLAISVLQTATLFCFILLGLRLMGRRVFSERTPQDLITIVLVAEACDLGLTHERAGYWGSFISILTIFLLGYLVDRVAFFRHLLNPKPIVLYNKGRLFRRVLERNMIDEQDLDEVARERGHKSYKSFASIVLEGDGRISGIEATGPRKPSKNKF